jgi:LPXTG-motif cell wall-anchored protein
MRRIWRAPRLVLLASTVGVLAFFGMTVASASAATPKVHAPATTSLVKKVVKPAAHKPASKPAAPATSRHLNAAKPKTSAKPHRHDPPDKNRHKTCEHGRDDCTTVRCEHGKDDCAPVPTCSEPGDDCTPATTTCSEQGDDCAPATTCSESGDDCAPSSTTTTPTQPTSAETSQQGALPFTGANVIWVAALGLFLSGGGLLLSRRLRRTES